MLKPLFQIKAYETNSSTRRLTDRYLFVLVNKENKFQINPIVFKLALTLHLPLRFNSVSFLYVYYSTYAPVQWKLRHEILYLIIFPLQCGWTPSGSLVSAANFISVSGKISALESLTGMSIFYGYWLLKEEEIRCDTTYVISY